MRKPISFMVYGLALAMIPLTTGCLSEQDAPGTPDQLTDGQTPEGEPAEGESEEAVKGDAKCKNGKTVAFMQAKVTKYCKGGNPNGNDNTLACSAGLRCSELSKRATATAWCLEARINIVNQCFNGQPDRAHAERLRYHSDRLKNCIDLEDAAVASGLCKPAGPRPPYPG